MTDKLIIVNLPHLKGLIRELEKRGQQHQNSAYARNFQKPDSHEKLNAKALAFAVAQGDAELREKYEKAFDNSSFDAMMNYYRRNYPREPYEEYPADFPKVQAPVLQFHGLNDTALLAPALNNTWEWLEKDWTLVTIPGVGHWSHHERPEMVTETMRWWLRMRQ
jgi:pimeloyl-ACP methyl ester carboxylesterase